MIELPFALETEAQKLALGWMRHFRTQDAALTYTHIETARFLQLLRPSIR